MNNRFNCRIKNRSVPRIKSSCYPENQINHNTPTSLYPTGLQRFNNEKDFSNVCEKFRLFINAINQNIQIINSRQFKITLSAINENIQVLLKGNIGCNKIRKISFSELVRQFNEFFSADSGGIPNSTISYINKYGRGLIPIKIIAAEHDIYTNEITFYCQLIGKYKPVYPEIRAVCFLWIDPVKSSSSPGVSTSGFPPIKNFARIGIDGW